MKQRQTKAQQQWEPGQVRPPRSVKTMFASSVLCLEAVLLLFFGLAMWGLNQGEAYSWWLLGGSVVFAVLLVLTCAVLRKPWGYTAGWVLQILMVLAFVSAALIPGPGFGVSLALVPSIGFVFCWYFAVSKGEELDREKQNRFEAEEEYWAEQNSRDPQ